MFGMKNLIYKKYKKLLRLKSSKKISDKEIVELKTLKNNIGTALVSYLNDHLLSLLNLEIL